MSTRLELSRQGWALLGAGLGLLVASRLLGAIELGVLGVAAGMLLGLAALWASSRRIDLELERKLRPARLHVGGDGRVDLLLENRSSRSTPLLAAADHVDAGRRAAQFLVPPLVPGQTARAAYRLPTGRRGRFTVGPMEATLTDPFGLVSRRTVIGAIGEVVVCPRVHDMPALDAAGGLDTARVPSAVRTTPVLEGDDFLTLRQYEHGDDLRRVHWRSSARAGEIMVRQHQTWWRPRTTVLLDTRADAHDDASFEIAVEVAASIVMRLTRAAEPVEIVTATGAVLGGTHPSAALLVDQLATVEPMDLHLRPEAARARLRAHTSGRLIAVLGAATSRDVAALTALDPARHCTLVFTRGLPPSIGAWGGALVVDVSAGDVGGAWNAAVTRSRVRRAARTGLGTRSEGP